MEKFRTYNELDRELKEKLSGLEGRIHFPNNGAVCIVDISKDWRDAVKEVRIFSQTRHNGSYGVSYGALYNLPHIELQKVAEMHWDDALEAYNWIVERAKKINKFFREGLLN